MNRQNPFRFEADFWDNEVLINQSIHYSTNAILTEILCMGVFTPYLKCAEGRLMDSFHAAFPSADEETYSEKYIQSFDGNIRKFAQIVEEIDQYRLKFPPYNKIMPSPSPLNRVFGVLDFYPHVWDDSFTEGLTRSIMAEGGYWDEGEGFGKYTPYSMRSPEIYPVEWISPNAPITDFHIIMEELRQICTECTDFLRSMGHISSAYQNLLENYVHIRNHFPTDLELAKSFRKYEQDNPSQPLKGEFHAEGISSSLCVIEKDGKPAITERYTFENTASFVYVDFLRGLRTNFVPKRCANCGRWFLIPGGKYLEYCSRPLELDPSKTCRNVGAQESYAQKCKENPIWEVHRRAYKTHFARQKKGIMTPEAFRIWADNAIIWRGQAERGELDFDTFYSMIRK